MRSSSRAFTLVEVLVAMAIFAFLSVLTFQTIDGSIRNIEVLDGRMQRLQDIQRTMRFLSRDITQAVPRPVRNPLDDSYRPAFSVATSGEFALEVTHGGWPNPAGTPRSTLQRSAWRIEDGQLIRVHWNVLDPTLANDPNVTVMLENIESLQFRFDLGNGQWTEQWPPQISNGPAMQSARPRLVEVVLTLPDEGELRRFFEVAL